MNARTRREIAATLQRQGRDDLARHFTTAQPNRVDKVLSKYKANMLSDLRLLIMKSGAAPGAQKQALQAVTNELADALSRVGQHLASL